jgi:hypothetical protein
MQAMVGHPRERRAGAIEHRKKVQQVTRDRVQANGLMRNRAVKTNGRAEASEEVQHRCGDEYSPAGKWRQHETRRSRNMDEDHPEEHGTVALRGAPPRLFPWRILSEIRGVECA